MVLSKKYQLFLALSLSILGDNLQAHESNGLFAGELQEKRSLCDQLELPFSWQPDGFYLAGDVGLRRDASSSRVMSARCDSPSLNQLLEDAGLLQTCASKAFLDEITANKAQESLVCEVMSSSGENTQANMCSRYNELPVSRDCSASPSLDLGKNFSVEKDKYGALVVSCMLCKESSKFDNYAARALKKWAASHKLYAHTHRLDEYGRYIWEDTLYLQNAQGFYLAACPHPQCGAIKTSSKTGSAGLKEIKYWIHNHHYAHHSTSLKAAVKSGNEGASTVKRSSRKRYRCIEIT